MLTKNNCSAATYGEDGLRRPLRSHETNADCFTPASQESNLIMSFRHSVFPAHITKNAGSPRSVFRHAPHQMRQHTISLLSVLILGALLAAPSSAFTRLSLGTTLLRFTQTQQPSLANGGFETPNLGSGFQYSPTGATWTFVGAGVSKNASAFTNGNPAAPEGSQVAFIQGGGSYLSQQISGFQPGTTYIVKFATAQRGNCCGAGGLDFQVLIDGTSLGTFRPTGPNYVEAATAIFTATASTHTLKFLGVNSSGGDNTALIDNVRVETATQPPSPFAGNGGFEAPVVGNSFQYGPTSTAWTFVGAGVSGNSSAFTNGNPAAPEGSQVAFIQGGGSYISQMVSSFRAGVSYSISFKGAQRGNCCGAGGLNIDVYLDSTLVGTFKPAGSSYEALSTAGFTTSAGAHILKFVGRNTSGGDNSALIDNVQINRLTANYPPAVSITVPASNATFTAPVAITINADASDEDGQVMKVEFFQNGTKIGEDFTSPFNYVWSNAPAGSYTLTAKATDDLGAQTTSAAVAVTVNPEKGRIAGKITKADGTTPIAGVIVKVYQGVTTAGTVSTNGTGDYVVTGLDDGTYTVEASAPEYIIKRQGGVSVTSGTTSNVNLSLGSAVSYAYDDLGRLVAAIDPTGEAATYNYDAVGNLLSISRSNSAQTSIAGFTPGEGAVGTSVIIRGTGFSANPGDNAVTFNGVSAVVTAATATQINVSVPAGASTGLIAVTTPSGSATSNSSFKVNGSTAPTVTGFSPTIGPVGTAVTISGTNFETIRTNNKVKVNLTSATVNSATTTSLSTKVEYATGSGHISVATPSGTAVSSADFFVTPASYTATDVEVTGRMAVGESKPVTIAASGKVGLILFDGTAGQRISLRVTDDTITNGAVTIYKPDGASLMSGPFDTSEGFLDAITLPYTGTYTILLDPNSIYTGNLILRLYNVVDVTSTITPGGASIPVTVGTPGQNAILSFNGSVGQRVSLNITSNTFGYIIYNNVAVQIKDPSGTVIGSGDLNGSGSTVYIDAVTLPVNGTYTLSLNPTGPRTGSATFTLNSVVDVTDTISVGGPAVSKSVTVPGQNIKLTFDATAGQRVSLATSISGFTSWPRLYILNPDGTVLTGPYSDSIGATTLPVTGTYAVFSDPYGSETGTQTFTLAAAP